MSLAVLYLYGAQKSTFAGRKTGAVEGGRELAHPRLNAVGDQFNSVCRGDGKVDHNILYFVLPLFTEALHLFPLPNDVFVAGFRRLDIYAKLLRLLQQVRADAVRQGGVTKL